MTKKSDVKEYTSTHPLIGRRADSGLGVALTCTCCAYVSVRERAVREKFPPISVVLPLLKVDTSQISDMLIDELTR